MKFSIASLSLLAVSFAAEFYAESSNGEVNGQGLSSRHEGAGINYFFLGKDADELTYHEENSTFYMDVDSRYPFLLSLHHDVLMVGVLGPDAFDISSGYLAINGTADNFFACKNINDPYHYSKYSYAVTFGGDTGDCTPMKIKVEDVDGSGSDSDSEPSVTSAVSPSPSPYTNTTSSDVTVITDHTSDFTVITDHTSDFTDVTTITDYTTYCPESTTITITTCDETCGPHTVTVDEPKTITVTGPCVLPTSSVPTEEPQPTTTMESQTPPAPSGDNSTEPTVSTIEENGAGKQAIGVTGLALLAAMLI